MSSQLQAPAALPQGMKHATHWVGDWMGPIADPDGFRKQNNLVALRRYDPNRAARNLISIATKHKTIRARGL
jgi:hypothetical protein